MLQTLYKEEAMKSVGELLNYQWSDTKDFLKKYDSALTRIVR